MQLRGIFACLVALGILACANVSRGALSSSNDSLPAFARGVNHIEAHQYQIANGRVPGNLSAHQSITAWQVTAGTWNGQSLDGLSLVLVQTVSEDGHALGTTNCYVSHLATAAQRKALVSAFVADRSTEDTSSDVQPSDPATWRIEPAVIRIDNMGETVVIHLGAIA